MNLKKLNLSRCKLVDVSCLDLPAMEELQISHNENLIVGSLPERLACMKVLTMEWCAIDGISTLNSFSNLNELSLSFNNALLLDTLPYNLNNL